MSRLCSNCNGSKRHWNGILWVECPICKPKKSNFQLECDLSEARSRIAALEAAIEGLNEFRFCSCGAGSINNEGHEDWCEKTYIVEWKRAALESK